MKLSRILPLVVGSAAAGVFISTAPAHALDFNFSLTNTQGSVSGTVTGTVQGLSDNATSAATDIIITSYPSGLNVSPAAAAPFSLFTYLNSVGGTGPQENSFTVLNGVITDDTFRYQVGNDSYQVFLGGGAGSFNYINLDGLNSDQVWGDDGKLVVSYTSAAAPATGVPFDIPGGATIPTVGSLVALGAMRKVKKRLALKTRIANPATSAVS